MKFIRDLMGKKRGDDGSQRRSSIESLEQSYRTSIADPKAGADEAPLQLDTPIEDAPEARSARRVVSVDRKEKGGLLKPAPRPAAKTEPVTQVPVASAPEPAPAAKGSVNIWDMDDDDAAAASATPAPAAPPVSSPRPAARGRRTKTRLIGFEKSDGDVVGLFDDAPKAAPVRSTKFPVGWLVIVDGPGRGESFALSTGMSQIGRGEDQSVQLDFGDNSVSRSNHAAIVYDPDSKEFLLGHGGKSNIVRLNDKPLISNEQLKTGDTIRIGETTLRFVALCGKAFNWTDGATGEDEDVAIA